MSESPVSTQLLAVAEESPELVQHTTVIYIPGDSLDAWQGEPANAASVTSTVLRYQTFIPDDYVYGFPPCASGVLTYFSGDNRSFNPVSGFYKTRFDVSIDWQNSGAISTSRSVKPSKLYLLLGGSYIYQETKTATTASMKYRTFSRDTNQSYFEFWQNVVNPFCPDLLNAGITFSYKVQVYKSGAYWMDGDSVAVPNHEVYIKDSDMLSWKTIFRHSHVDFTCLSGYVVDPNYCINASDYAGVR
jgi:hypothetical protein